MHNVKETYMLAAKMDLLLKRLDIHDDPRLKRTVQAMDHRMTCEVCGNTGHSGNDCPETHEEAAFVNNGYRPQGGHG